MSIDPPEFQKEIKHILPKKWDYNTFRDYLLSQARGNEFFLRYDEYPEEIELNKDWHEVLNSLRDGATDDGIERVALVGFNQTTRSIYLPNKQLAKLSWGKFEHDGHQVVNPILEVIQKGRFFSKGIEGSIGVLHSHPPVLKIGKIVINFGQRGRLSAGDLFIPLSTTNGQMIGVADGSINSLAFRTRESILTRESHSKFYDLWEGDPQPKELDILIAKKYKLALYRGKVNGSLKRVA